MRVPEDGGFWVRDPRFYRDLILLAVPIMLQNLITFGVGFADNLMIGSLGEEALSGLYLGAIVQVVLQILVFGIESSLLVLSAQYWGRRDRDRIKDVISIGMRVTLAASLAIALTAGFFPHRIMATLTSDPGAAEAGANYLRTVSVSYLFFGASQILIAAMRSVEIVRIGLINSMAAFCINIFLNYVLIFGHFGAPALGVTGAAAATDISRVAELGIVLYFVLRLDRNLRLRLTDFLRWSKPIFHDLVRCGTPLVLGQAVWAFNNYAQTMILGRLPASSIAAASIAGMLDKLLWMGTWGFAIATGILVGKAIGAGEFAQVRRYAKTMQIVFLGIGLAASAAVYFGHPLFLSLYSGISSETRAAAVRFMMVLSVTMFGRCYQAPSLYGLVKSGGDTAFVFKNDAFWVFCWVIPLALTALYFRMPDWVVFACLLSDQITKCFVAAVKINSFNWMKDLTRKPS